jgi:hypothetical protein
VSVWSTNVAGCLADSSGKRIANAQILLEGKDYSGYTITTFNVLELPV